MIPWRRVPLATRIALLFAAVTVLVLAIAGVHLYRSMSLQLQLQDDVLLLNTVSLMQRRLAEAEGVEMVRFNPHPLVDIFLGQGGLLLVIKDSRGDLLAASTYDSALLSIEASVPVDRSPDARAIRDWRGADGKRGRVIGAWVRVGRAPGDPVQLIVARERTTSAVVLREHRNDLLLTMLVGVLAATVLGYAIARRGLRPVRMVAETAREVTANQLGERLRIEDAPAELQEMVRAFNRMLERLEDSFRRLTQFSSDIAHDLRTPISNLMLETQVALAQRRSTSEYQELLASNIEEYERLTRMIENMLFLARADNAQVALSKDAISAEPELKRVAEYFEGMAGEKDITLDVAGSGALVADAILFRRAVSNLVANAIRHTPSGGRVTIRGHEQEAGKFAITVSNPGSGIPAEQLPRIFDRFYRVDDSRSESQSSSGLGLAIVKSIATLHGGNVHAESIPDGLTTFSLVFPGARDNRHFQSQE